MILGIDTSGENLGLAVCNQGKLIASSLTKPGLRHGEIIQNMIDGFLKENNLCFNDLTGISATLGPGSFTGLRIGLAAAKGYSCALQIPLTGISTLLAGSAAFSHFTGKIVVIIDVRRKEYYWAAFDCSDNLSKRFTPDRVGPINSLKESAGADVVFFGPSHLKGIFDSEIEIGEYYNNDDFNLAIPASLYGEQDIKNSRNMDIDSLSPIYLRSGIKSSMISDEA